MRSPFWVWLCLLGGCLTPPPTAPVYFKQSLDHLPLSTLQKDIPGNIGKKVMYGGIIVEVQNYSASTEMVISERPLNYQDIPIKTGYSSGYYLAVFKGYLDRLVYAPGRLMTVAGEVIGQRVEERYGIFYIYPVIHAQFFHLWPPQEPYYYPPWYQPELGDEKPPPFWH
jgi:outer membrane lipoprotein